MTEWQELLPQDHDVIPTSRLRPGAKAPERNRGRNTDWGELRAMRDDDARRFHSSIAMAAGDRGDARSCKPSGHVGRTGGCRWSGYYVRTSLTWTRASDANFVIRSANLLSKLSSSSIIEPRPVLQAPAIVGVSHNLIDRNSMSRVAARDAGPAPPAAG